ncbi:MAG TPA: hypothetical protein VFY03_13090, partial [Woeseiaceae bacterium]|nr:hypothetical protein [Woeseiaceae bacterium]
MTAQMTAGARARAGTRAGTQTPGSLLDRLERGAVAPGGFDHRAHLEAAFEALRADDFLAAAARYSRAIERFATATGARDKFSMTITLAFLSLMAERVARGEYAGFEEFLAANPDLAGNVLGG